MLNILYNDFYIAKRSIALFMVLILIPNISALLRISILMILVINCVRLVCFNDYKNKSILFYSILPISRKLYILEKVLFFIIVYFIGLFALFISLLVYGLRQYYNYSAFILFITGVIMLFCGMYILISYVFNPIKADLFNEIIVSIISLICGKLFIFDRLSIASIIPYINSISHFVLVASLFSLIICTSITCLLFTKKDL